MLTGQDIREPNSGTLTHASELVVAPHGPALSGDDVELGSPSVSAP